MPKYKKIIVWEKKKCMKQILSFQLNVNLYCEKVF